VAVAEHTLRSTSTALAPWKIVEGMDHRYRSLAVATMVRDAIRARLNHTEAVNGALERTVASGLAPEVAVPDAATRTLAVPLKLTVLSDLDMSLTVSKRESRRQLPRAQGRVNRLFREAKARGISLIGVFEGWDAGGKGGAIRRLTRALDARDYRVIPINRPTDEEAAHHYLWRFWRHIRRAGRVTIFDRSWYGRVLVERVEGFASEDEWRRAYTEINDFETQLTDFGIVLLKFWLHITPEEQLRRFEQRQQIPYKRWKITDEDWRNREKWPQYEEAVQEMVERTSTVAAPWTLVEGNCKRYARLKVLRTVADALEEAIERGDPQKKGKKKNSRA
jgi:polyphosphate kinase 2 (PPK2 family)